MVRPGLDADGKFPGAAPVECLDGGKAVDFKAVEVETVGASASKLGFEPALGAVEVEETPDAGCAEATGRSLVHISATHCAQGSAA